MELSKRVRDNVVVLGVEGKLVGTIGSGVGLADAVLASLADDETGTTGDLHHVLLDLAACTGADSLGIGELISLHVRLSNHDGSLKLLQVPGSIGDLLRATQLISMFELFDDEDEALESFS